MNIGVSVIDTVKVSVRTCTRLTVQTRRVPCVKVHSSLLGRTPTDRRQNKVESRRFVHEESTRQLMKDVKTPKTTTKATNFTGGSYYDFVTDLKDSRSSGTTRMSLLCTQPIRSKSVLDVTITDTQIISTQLLYIMYSTGSCLCMYFVLIHNTDPRVSLDWTLRGPLSRSHKWLSHKCHWNILYFFYSWLIWCNLFFYGIINIPGPSSTTSFRHKCPLNPCGSPRI